jgi:hypothetical protein
MSWTFKVVKGDIVRKPVNNGYDSVTGLDKLRQECRMVLTSGVRRSGIGTGLERILGRTTDNEPDLGWSSPPMLQFQQWVRDGLSRYRYVQRNFQFSRRTPAELLDDFSPVQIWMDGTDPRVFRWRVDFYTLGKLPNFALGGTTR